MAETIVKPRRRLTREESRAQTRAALIAVGRRHFLRYGLGGAVTEKIAEDAGYSRVPFIQTSTARKTCFSLSFVRSRHGVCGNDSSCLSG